MYYSACILRVYIECLITCCEEDDIIVMDGERTPIERTAVLITCCEEDDIIVMDDERIPIERTAALINRDIVGEVLVPSVLESSLLIYTEISMNNSNFK